MAHVLRDGKKYLIDSKDIIVSDLVYLDARVSGIIPADIILFEASADFEIESYKESFDVKNKHNLRQEKDIPQGATHKSVPEEGAEMPDMILDAPNFVPMGAKLVSGNGKGICIRIGNNTIKALLDF